jgi:dihydrofolate reductase
MSTVTFDISMSLDGFIRAANPTPEEPLGQGGERLHEWAMDRDDARSREYLESAMGGTGAVITGRTNYDDSLPWWDADGPTGDLRLPVFVVTHAAPPTAPDNGVYRFATEGIERAPEDARAAAGNAGVTVMGGADIGRQYLAAGLVDQISLHVVPVLFGGGLPLFDDGLFEEHVELEPAGAIETPAATHLRFRVLRRR